MFACLDNNVKGEEYLVCLVRDTLLSGWKCRPGMKSGHQNLEKPDD